MLTYITAKDSVVWSSAKILCTPSTQPPLVDKAAVSLSVVLPRIRRGWQGVNLAEVASVPARRETTIRRLVGTFPRIVPERKPA